MLVFCKRKCRCKQKRTNFGGTFDYGNGDCDNQATFTFNNGTMKLIK